MAGFAVPQFTFFYQGQLAASGSVYVYQTGTTTTVPIYSDSGLTTPLSNPLNLDANGQCKFYVSGSVNLRLDAYTGLAGAGTLIESVDPVFPVGGASGLTTEATLASASTTDLGTATSNIIDITGTTTITAFGSSASSNNPLFFLRFIGALILTYNATSFILPGQANITTVAGDTCVVQYMGSGNWKILSYAPISGNPVSQNNMGFPQDFRLTLTSVTPVTTSDVTGATTIFCTPYKGNRISLYDGSANWITYTSAEFSLALGTLTSGKPYDVFCFSNSGVPTLEFLVWTNDTTRATALVYQNGVLVKSGATTRRYLGTFYTTATTTTEDSLAKRYLYNYYNRVAHPMQRLESTASWTYTTATLRQANGSASNQLNFVQGVAEDSVSAQVNGMVSNSSSSVNAEIAIGVNSTTTATGPTGMIGLPSNGVLMGGSISYNGIPGVGRQFLVWLEAATATGTATWTGVNGINQTGITGSMMG